MPDIETLARESPDALEPGIVPSGGGFRAVLRHDGAVVWRCPHVHFTDHSARACNALRAVLRSDGAAS